jgi:nucleotide-binding universal stress UspA family protein
MYEKVLVTVDLNDAHSWQKALPAAVEFSRKFGSALHLIAVVPDFGLPSVAQFFPDDFADKACAEAGKELEKLAKAQLPADIEVEHTVAYGTPYTEILQAAEKIDCDLILMTSHRPELKDYLLGPNAARVVRHAACSVLVLRD